MSTSMMPDQATVRALLRGIGMDVPEFHITPVSGGTVNLAYRIDSGGNGPLIMRISPTDEEAAAGPSWLTSHGLRREQTTINLFDDLTEMLPRTVYFDESREHIERDWVLQTWVRGIPWKAARRDLTNEQDLALWRELGGIIRRMHAIAGVEFGPPEEGLGYTAWSDLLRWDAAGLAVDASRYGIDVHPFDGLQEVIDRSVDVLDHVTDPRLIHSDLNERHIFISAGKDGEPHITGLIDFEFARFADPYSESVFIDDGLLTSEDVRRLALCEGYDCDKPTRVGTLRSMIYTAIAVGWGITDMARKKEQRNIPQLLSRLDELVLRARDAM